MNHKQLPRHASLLKLMTALAVIAMLASARLSAQTSASGNTPTAEAQTALGLEVTAEYEHVFSSDLKKGAPGDITVNRLQISADSEQKTQVGKFNFGASYTYTNYSFSGINPSPFGNVEKLTAYMQYERPIKEGWGVFVYTGGGFAAETAASLSQGGLFALMIGPSCQVNPDLYISFGPMYYTRLEQDDTFTTGLKVDWKIDPQWALHAFAGVSYGIKMTYDIFTNGQTVLDFGMRYDSNWFRTRGVAAGSQAVNETQYTFSVGVTQRFMTQFFVRAYIEGVCGRKYQFHTNGHSSNSFEADAGAGFGLEVGADF